MTPVPEPRCDPASLTIVTGAGGWFGRAFLDAVAAPRPEHGPVGRAGEVRVLVGSAAEVEPVLAALPRAVVHVGDIADQRILAALLDGAEGASLVHAAGVIHPRRVADFEAVNVLGTDRLLTAAVSAQVRRVVHISSNSAVGVNATRHDTFRQHEPYRPYLGYGESKMRAEQLVEQARLRHGLSTVVLRPPWFHGPFAPPRQTRFLSLVAAGRFPVLGDGGQRRSMVHVDNLVQAVALAERVPGADGGTFWVADAETPTMRTIVATVQRVLVDQGYRVSGRTVRAPALVGRVAEGVDRALQRRGRYLQEVHVLGEMDKTIACDISATRIVLGYDPRVGLEDGLHSTVRWYADQGVQLAPRRMP